MEQGEGESPRKIIYVNRSRLDGDANTHRKRTRRVISNGRKDTKKLIKERKSIVRTETKNEDKKCCQPVALKTQHKCNISSNSPIKHSADGSKKVISLGQTVTDEKADCKRKPLERCVKKQKLADSTNDASSDQQKLADSADDASSDQQKLADSADDASSDQQKLADSANDASSDQQKLADSADDASSDQQKLDDSANDTSSDQQKLTNNANDASPDHRTRASISNEQLAQHTTIVKMCVDGCERAMYRCGYCNKWKTSVALKSNMLAHLAKHESGVLRCMHCGHDSATAPELNEHMARVHTHRPQFVCALCGKESFTRKQLRQHEDVHNLHPRDCRHCGQMIRSLAQLKKHMKTEHGGDGLYSCDECHKTFVFKKWFDAHKARQACGRRAPCSLCGAEIVKGGGMSAHMRRVHGGEKHVQCSFCPFSAFTKTQVRLHERTHTRDHPYTCHHCPYSAAKKYQLTSHLRTHTGEKPFHCEQCPFASSWKVQLRAHQVAHTSSTALTCDTCAVVCKDAWSLRVHSLREHKQSAGNQKPITKARPTTRCERAVKSDINVTSADLCQRDTEVTSEHAAESTDEVTSYIIVNEAVAKDIERLGLETVALVLFDDTTDGATVAAQNPASGDATQCIEFARIPGDVDGEPAKLQHVAEDTEKEIPSSDIAVVE